MKRVVVIFLLITIAAAPAKTATLADLLHDFRGCVNEPDSAKALCSDSMIMLWLNMAQHKITNMSGYLPKWTDIPYLADSNIYPLPGDFERLKEPGAVMVWGGMSWVAAFYNPGMRVDTNATCYDIKWKHADSAYILVRGKYLGPGQAIKVEYLARAPDIFALTDSCHVPSNLHSYIIEEAISYYERAKRNFSAYKLISQSVRLDLGVIKAQEGNVDTGK